MFGLYLPILSLTVLNWLGSSEIEFIPVVLICGTGLLLVKVLEGFITILRSRQTSRSERVRRNNQSVIDWVVLNVFGLNKTMKSRSFTKQQHIMLTLVKSLLKLPLDRSILEYISDADFSELLLIEDVEKGLELQRYQEVIPRLEELSQTYGMTPWIYSRFRKCYLALDDLEGLEKINLKSGSEVNLHEVEIKRLVRELPVAKDSTKKRLLFEALYKLAPEYEIQTEQYFKLLQEAGEYDLLLRLVRNSWLVANSMQIARIVLSVFTAHPSKFKLNVFVESLPPVESGGHALLKLHSHLSLGEVNKAKSIPIEIMRNSEITGHILQLELANTTRDAKLLADAIDGILSLRISYEKTLGLNG